ENFPISDGEASGGGGFGGGGFGSGNGFRGGGGFGGGPGGGRPTGGSGRVPPHNLQAEESVLGALLLSRDAIGAVGEAGLGPRDFYNPAHQQIFDAIRALYSGSSPVDVVTVADELRRHAILDQIGGIERLNELQNMTPSVSGAEHYAKIVMDTALLRRLIHTAGEITDIAFGEPDDVIKAVDLAESKMFEVAEDRVTDTTRPIQDLLNLTMDQLEENYERGDTITGAATGYDDLDELLSGLQPSTLNIVGARPAMGKCVAWYTPMVDLETGEVVTAEELMERATARGRLQVRSLDDTGRIVTADVSACLDDGVKPVFRVTTRSGRSVVTTASHPFLTARGWQRLEHVLVGDDVAVPTVRDQSTESVANDDDSIPAHVWFDVEKAKGDMAWSALFGALDGGDRLAAAVGHPIRRADAVELAAALDRSGLDWWASPDMVWDPIVSIEPLGDDRVIDFTVPGLHNFIAADFFLHNTAFGLGMASHIAKNSHQPVLVFSLEMGHSELTQRILSSEAKVDSSKLRTGKLTESDWSKIGLAVGRLEVPLFLDDNPQVTVMEIRAKARRIKAQHGGLSLILIDYLQLMSGSGQSENRQLEVSEISRNLKVLARELECPIVALSQLSRNLEARSDKRPMLADLRESGSLEQDADVVMFLYRDEVYNPESPDKGSAEVIVAKHRAGPIGTKRLVFLGQYTRFDNAARSM
ncbi:MAG: replicative DNA helicase, partial [Actinomycetota bacterium]